MILSAALVYMIVKHQNVKKLLFFFFIPIIMIAYPSIQEVQIEDGKVAFTKYKDDIRNNPNDSTAIAQIEELIEKLESRAKTPKDVAEISEAYLLLGKPDKAISTANNAIQNNAKIDSSQLKVLKDYKKVAELEKDIQTNKISKKDTAQIKARLKGINLSNTKTKTYFKKKYTTPTTLNLKPIRGNQ
jgi:hypothetical protein